jgi:hypothetical protein
MPPIYVEVDDPKKDIRQQKIIEINYFCDECDKRLFPDQGDSPAVYTPRRSC